MTVRNNEPCIPVVSCYYTEILFWKSYRFMFTFGIYSFIYHEKCMNLFEGALAKIFVEKIFRL